MWPAGTDAFIQQCCRIATNPRRNNRSVARAESAGGSAAAAEHLDVEVADLLAQGVAVEAEQLGGPDLVAARGRQRRGHQRLLDLPQDAVIEAGRRQVVARSRRSRPPDAAPPSADSGRLGPPFLGPRAPRSPAAPAPAR